MARSRSQKNSLLHSLDAATCPVYLLDERRCIAYANPALAQWLGVALDQVLGLHCRYHSDTSHTSLENLVAGLSPPPNVGRSAQRQIVVSCQRADQKVQRRAQCVSFDSGTTETSAVLVFVESHDMTDMRHHALNENGDIDGHAEIIRLRAEMKVEYAIERFVGLSPDMRVARKRVEMAIRANENVLISGPPGSGREFVARMIHVSSDTWGSTPLVTLSCPVLDDELLESTIAELMQRCGELELEHPPSLLLLDVDQLSEVAQHSLQGILSIGELELRTLATSSMSSAVLQQRNDFRRDLAVMLATVDIDLPPLVQRKQDIALLIQAELERRNQQGTQQLQGVTREALEYWLAYDWPGNVDELLSTVEQACRLATGPWLDLAALPANLRHAQTAVKYPPQENEEIELDSYLQRIERELIVRALRKAKGNKAEAARLLGIARGRLLRRLSQLGLEGDAS